MPSPRSHAASLGQTPQCSCTPRSYLWRKGGSLMAAIEFTLNGKIQKVDVPSHMPLLWVLRDTIGLTGTKYGCGMALCGACTVHLDGAPVRSCVTPVSAVGSKKITTIEGLDSKAGKAVQAAWQELDVV